jgi:hypothetical protein
MKQLPLFKHLFLSFLSLLIIIFVQCSEEPVLLPSPVVDTVQTPPVTDSTGVRDSIPADTIAVPVAQAPDCSTCTHIIPPNRMTVDGRALGIKPGDVICLNAAVQYSVLAFQYIEGTPDNPVTIRNCGGRASINATGHGYGIRFIHSRYIRVSGGDSPKTYGISITGSKQNGLVMGKLTSNFQVDHLEIYEVGFAGIMAKTDPGCDDALNRGNFTMRDVSIHDNYIHNVKGEGLYIGHSSYGGVDMPCGRKFPHTIEGLRIYGNIIEHTGWDGLQVSSATTDVWIFNNRITDYGTLNHPAHNNGLQLGGGTGGECYNNYIRSGTGNGMAVFGLRDNLVHDNVIVDAGSAGIFCDERSEEKGHGYSFINNTIINPKRAGLNLYSERTDNYVYNNIVVIDKSTGTTVPHLLQLNKNMHVEIKNNLFARDIEEVAFVDVWDGNYRLSASSPARDKGTDISDYGIAKDFYLTKRLKGSQYDIGASEF